jgi:hypothetical protein
VSFSVDLEDVNQFLAVLSLATGGPMAMAFRKRSPEYDEQKFHLSTLVQILSNAVTKIPILPPCLGAYESILT